MAEEALITRLPKDVKISTYGTPMRIGVSMTLTSSDHARALKQAIDMAIIPLFEIEEKEVAIAREVASAKQQIADGTATEVDPLAAD